MSFRRILSIAAGAVALPGVTVIAVSLASRDESGFLHRPAPVALDGRRDARTATGPPAVDLLAVRVDTAAGPGSWEVPADGVFYVVTLAVPSDAPFVATVVDGGGRRYQRARDVEQLLEQHAPVRSPGHVRLVFDLPDRVSAPTLVLREPGFLARLFGPRVALSL